MPSLCRPGVAAIAIAIPGILSFIFAVIGENKKPSPILVGSPRLVYNSETDTTTCFYPSDLSLALGILAIIFLFISAMISFTALHYPYQGKAVSVLNLWRSKSLVIFTIISLLVFLLAEGFLIWVTIVEFYHRKNPVHSGQLYHCPTGKFGLLGGAGFLALDATLMFLISLLLTVNARSDYLDDFDGEDGKGTYGELFVSEQQPGLNSPDA